MNSFKAALAGDPDSALVAYQSYRQGLQGGDAGLAVDSARILDAMEMLPRDGHILLFSDAVGRQDWKQASALLDRFTDNNLVFLTPLLRSCTSVERGHYVPPVTKPGQEQDQLATRYVAENHALQMLARGKLDDAIEAAKPLVTVKASDVGAFRLVMAQGLAAAGRRDDALALLPDNDPDFATARELIRSGRRNIGDRMDVSKGVSWLFYRLADDLAVGGGQSMALNFARFAQFAEPGSALADLCAARQLLANGDPEASLAELGKIPVGSALAAAGDHIRVTALERSGQGDAAVALARTIAGRDGAGGAAYIQFGNLLSRQKLWMQAAQAFAAAEKSYGADGAPWTLYLLWGSALERGGNWAEAEPLLQKALALKPDEPVLLNYLGYAQIERRENIPGALTMLKKAQSLRPDDAAIADSFGWAQYLSGDPRAAVPMLEKAVAGAPDDPTVNEHLGDVLWSVGRKFEARYAWRAAKLIVDEKEDGKARSRLSRKIETGMTVETHAP